MEQEHGMSETPFDFDRWAALARDDPEAFEARRQQAINELIANAPEELRQRLERFQWRIDMERARCSNPLQACIRISNMMWDLVYADRGFLWSLQVLSNPGSLMAPLPAESNGGAEVVTLRPPRRP